MFKNKTGNKNEDSGFYVDRKCIDCDACREMAPQFYEHGRGKSEVHNLPKNQEERVEYLKALYSCPVDAIHAGKLEKGDLKLAQKSLPYPFLDTKNIFATGWTASNTYGCWGYLITRPDGNVMVDVPRYNPSLAKRIEEMGGIKYMLMTHSDDIGDHRQWAEHFGAQRIMHEEEIDYRSQDMETKLQGEGPWDIAGLEDFEIIFTPGHTTGHLSFYYKPEKAIFTGDHMNKSQYNDDVRMLESYNKMDHRVQYQSALKILKLDIMRIIPGHGRAIKFSSLNERSEKIQNFVDVFGARYGR